MRCREEILAAAGLIWVGPGAIVGFDGSNLVLTGSFLLFGIDASGPGWT
jgi:hypothetical protein